MTDRQTYIELLVLFTNKDERLFDKWTDERVEEEYRRLILKDN